MMAQFNSTEYSLNAFDLADIFGVSVQSVYQKLKKDSLGYKHLQKGYLIPSPDVRKIFESKGIQYHHKVISFQCCKGGVGKTSLAYSLGIRANMYGAKVLLVDLDMQGHLTLGFTNDGNAKSLVTEEVPVWANLIRGDVQSVKDIIKPITNTLHIIPSNLNNSVLENLIVQNIRRMPLSKVVKSYLSEVENDYDYIIIDCAPGFSAINTGAMYASNLIIIPAAPDRYGVDGVSKTVSELIELRKGMDLNFDIKILLNRYDARKRLSVEQLVKLQAQYPNFMLTCYIRENSEIPNATNLGVSVFDMPKKKTPSKEDLDVLTREIMGIRS
jgi:chromosome partitioning protein